MENANKDKTLKELECSECLEQQCKILNKIFEDNETYLVDTISAYAKKQNEFVLDELNKFCTEVERQYKNTFDELLEYIKKKNMQEQKKTEMVLGISLTILIGITILAILIAVL